MGKGTYWQFVTFGDNNIKCAKAPVIGSPSCICHDMGTHMTFNVEHRQIYFILRGGGGGNPAFSGLSCYIIRNTGRDSRGELYSPQLSVLMAEVSATHQGNLDGVSLFYLRRTHTPAFRFNTYIVCLA